MVWREVSDESELGGVGGGRLRRIGGRRRRDLRRGPGTGGGETLGRDKRATAGGGDGGESGRWWC